MLTFLIFKHCFCPSSGGATHFFAFARTHSCVPPLTVPKIRAEGPNMEGTMGGSFYKGKSHKKISRYIFPFGLGPNVRIWGAIKGGGVSLTLGTTGLDPRESGLGQGTGLRMGLSSPNLFR